MLLYLDVFSTQRFMVAGILIFLPVDVSLDF